MNELIKINNHELQVKEYNGQRVVTFKDIDECHERPEGTARKRFNDNKKHFIEGIDYFVLCEPSVLRSLGIERPQGGTPEKTIVVSESGYFMITKPMKDDLSWEVQRMLVNTYFQVKEEMSPELKMAYGLVAAQSIIVQKEKLIAELEPKASYYDRIMKCKDLINTTAIAKDYDMSAAAFNKLLHEHKIQFKQGRQWFLYAKYHGHGYTGSHTTEIETENDDFSVMDTKWTQKGRAFLYRFLKKQGIVPTMERLNLFPAVEPSQRAAA